MADLYCDVLCLIIHYLLTCLSQTGSKESNEMFEEMARVRGVKADVGATEMDDDEDDDEEEDEDG